MTPEQREKNKEAFDHLRKAVDAYEEFCTKFDKPGFFEANEKTDGERKLSLGITVGKTKDINQLDFLDKSDVNAAIRFFGVTPTIKSVMDDLRKERKQRIEYQSELQVYKAKWDKLQEELTEAGYFDEKV